MICSMVIISTYLIYFLSTHSTPCMLLRLIGNPKPGDAFHWPCRPQPRNITTKTLDTRAKSAVCKRNYLSRSNTMFQCVFQGKAETLIVRSLPCSGCHVANVRNKTKCRKTLCFCYQQQSLSAEGAKVAGKSVNLFWSLMKEEKSKEQMARNGLCNNFGCVLYNWLLNWNVN